MKSYLTMCLLILFLIIIGCVSSAQDSADSDIHALKADSSAVEGLGLSLVIESRSSIHILIQNGSNWSHTANLPTNFTAEWWSSRSNFDIDGNTAIAGETESNETGFYKGSAYIFTRSGQNWTETARLIPNDGGNWRTGYGLVVAVHGNTAIVGAMADYTHGENSGSAYIFTRSGTQWVQTAKLSASDTAEFDYFGSSVAIHGNTVIVGAPNNDNDNYNGPSRYDCANYPRDPQCANPPQDLWYIDYSENSGSAYIFTRSGTQWVQTAKLTAHDGSPQDFFGSSVAIHGNIVAIASLGDDDKAENSGSVYIFTRSGTQWVQTAKLSEGNNAANWNEFGSSLTIVEHTKILDSLSTNLLQP